MKIGMRLICDNIEYIVTSLKEVNRINCEKDIDVIIGFINEEKNELYYSPVSISVLLNIDKIRVYIILEEFKFESSKVVPRYKIYDSIFGASKITKHEIKKLWKIFEKIVNKRLNAQTI